MTNGLWAALTSQPHTIDQIILEIPLRLNPVTEHAEVVGGQRQNLVGNILDGIFDTNTTPDYAAGPLTGIELKPSVSVKLTDGRKYPIPAVSDAPEIIAALERLAPHAPVTEIDLNFQD